MAATTAEIRKEIETLQRSVDGWEQEKKQLEALIEPARKELASWTFILQRREGEGSGVLQSVQAAAHGDQESAGASVEDYGGKSDIIRNFIVSSTGFINAGVIRDHLKSQNLAISQNYIYKVIDRMVAEGSLEKIAKKFRYTGGKERINQKPAEAGPYKY